MARQFVELEILYRSGLQLRYTREQRAAAGRLSQTIHNSGDGDDISVYGHSGGYSGEVRCIISKNIVVFFTTGPKLDQATKYRQAVMEKF